MQYLKHVLNLACLRLYFGIAAKLVDGGIAAQIVDRYEVLSDVKQ